MSKLLTPFSKDHFVIMINENPVSTCYEHACLVKASTIQEANRLAVEWGKEVYKEIPFGSNACYWSKEILQNLKQYRMLRTSAVKELIQQLRELNKVSAKE